MAELSHSSTRAELERLFEFFTPRPHWTHSPWTDQGVIDTLVLLDFMEKQGICCVTHLSIPSVKVPSEYAELSMSEQDEDAARGAWRRKGHDDLKDQTWSGYQFLLLTATPGSRIETRYDFNTPYYLRTGPETGNQASLAKQENGNQEVGEKGIVYAGNHSPERVIAHLTDHEAEWFGIVNDNGKSRSTWGMVAFSFSPQGIEIFKAERERKYRELRERLEYADKKLLGYD